MIKSYLELLGEACNDQFVSFVLLFTNNYHATPLFSDSIELDRRLWIIFISDLME
jgi:hypothetical protein